MSERVLEKEKIVEKVGISFSQNSMKWLNKQDIIMQLEYEIPVVFVTYVRPVMNNNLYEIFNDMYRSGVMINDLKHRILVALQNKKKKKLYCE